MLTSFLNSHQNCSKNRPVGMTSQRKYVEAACSGQYHIYSCDPHPGGLADVYKPTKP